MVLALGATMLLWASAYAGIRAGLVSYTPGQLAVFRFLTASLVLAVYAGLAHFRRPAVRDLPGLVVIGILGVSFYNLALNYGETRVVAGAASLLIASVPIWTALLARFFLRERLTVVGWLGVFVSFTGVALIASGEGEGIRLSPQALFILAAAVSSAIYMVVLKQYQDRYNALEFTAYTIWFGTLFMLPFGGGLGHAITRAAMPSTLAVIYLGIFPGAIAYVAWAYVLSHGPAGRTASYLFVNPVLAICIAWIWLGEVPRRLSLVGGAIALAGVVMVNLWGRVGAPMLAVTCETEAAD